MDVCELSDLPVDQCACMKHGPTPAEASPVVAKFPARFDSRCDSCGAQMYEGDLIGRTDAGDYICGSCWP